MNQRVDTLNSIEQVRASSVPVFRFLVEANGKSLGVFTECSLPVIEWELEEVKEGGQNGYAHQLPGRRKSARLTLKNGVGNSELMEWFWQMLDEKIARKNLTVQLLATQDTNSVVMTLHIQNAYPVKWSGPTLKADDNSIAIQTVEFVCGQITKEKPGE